MSNPSPGHQKVIMTESAKPIVYVSYRLDDHGNYYLASGLPGIIDPVAGGSVEQVVREYVGHAVTARGYKGARVIQLNTGSSLPEGDQIFEVMFRG